MLAQQKPLLDEYPIDALDSDIILGEFARMPLGIKRAKFEWTDQISWGDE
jgi:hypothetical protein